MLVVDPSLLSEFLPRNPVDGTCTPRFLLADRIPSSDRVLVIFIIQSGGQWRWLFVAAAFPAFIAFLARTTVPESPFYSRDTVASMMRRRSCGV